MDEAIYQRMTSRRKFLKQSSLASLAAFSFPALIKPQHQQLILDATEKIKHVSPDEVAMDETYWATITDAYSVSPEIINVNNGGVSPQPIMVQDRQNEMNRMSNLAPSYYMWRVLDQGREPLREKLALLANCAADEIAINRNSTEGLETIIYGIDLLAGDEVILTKQDYPNMMNAWKLREKRHGIKLVWLNLELPQETDEYFVDAYVNAVTEKTKVIHVTHIINWNGQILPVKKIADAVRQKNPTIKVVVDGAHSFCHFQFSVPDLGGDYFATSLHKWLGAPFGTGMLWVKKENISALWPLFANDKTDSDDIRKFEALGTRSFPAEQAIGYSINFHNAIGSERKEARLRYLKNYWCEKVKDTKGVKLYTSLKPEYSCAIGSFSIDGMEVSKIDSTLFDKYKIHAVGINIENFHHIRVTPNVYTTLYDLDKLVKAIKQMAEDATH